MAEYLPSREPRSGEVHILPLFTEIEKNNCFSIYTGSDLNNIFRRKPLKIDLLLTKQDKNTTNNTTKIRYVNYLLHSTSLQYTTFTLFFIIIIVHLYT